MVDVVIFTCPRLDDMVGGPLEARRRELDIKKLINKYTPLEHPSIISAADLKQGIYTEITNSHHVGLSQSHYYQHGINSIKIISYPQH